MKAIFAGVLYFASVFAVGFALGTLRVFILEPKLGATMAVLTETPFILTASWFLCRHWVHKLSVTPMIAARLLMGVFAFAFLLSAEFALARFGFDLSLTEQLASYKTAPGALGLAGQTLFGLFPAIQLFFSSGR